MNVTKRAAMYEQIERHGEDLKTIFNLPADTDPVKLCKKLFSIEKRIHRIMVNLCNTNNVQGIEPHYEMRTGVRSWVQIETPEEEQDRIFAGFMAKIVKILGDSADLVIFNHDPRGYTLKISDRVMKEKSLSLYSDWGGYGIIAPDFSA